MTARTCGVGIPSIFIDSFKGPVGGPFAQGWANGPFFICTAVSRGETTPGQASTLVAKTQPLVA